MRVIWKQKLELSPESQTFTLPGFDRVVHVGIQNEDITLWFLADPSGSIIYSKRTFQIFGTGDKSIPDNAMHLGTVQMRFYVWHVFELPDSEVDS